MYFHIIAVIIMHIIQPTYTYVYNCETGYYIKLDRSQEAVCTLTGTHASSYEVGSDLGIITTEEKLIKAHGIASVHKGCYITL